MSLTKEIKKSLRQVRQWPLKIKKNLHRSFPQVMGHMVHGAPVQLYRHDAQFTTAVSFNHFIEFFSNIPKMTISTEIEAFDRNGRSLGKTQVTLDKKGAFQFLLSDFFKNLDQYGLFSVAMKVNNGYIEDLSYLGAFYPQYMTVFVPTDDLSSPQMIHSHKLRQGHLWTARTLRRSSSDIESTEGLKKLDLYFLNSSASDLKTQLDIFSGQNGKKLKTFPLEIPGYGIGHIQIQPSTLPENLFRFEYQFDRNVDHKKPILFRQFSDMSWSCNHT